MSLQTNRFEFGEFVLDDKEKALTRGGKPVSITPKAFELLRVFVENQGHLVEKDELMNTVWAGSFVEEGNIAFTVRLLRKLLEDDAKSPRFIETVQRRGYRFIAEVRKTAEPTAKIPELFAPSDIIETIKPAAAERKQTPQDRPYFLIITGTILLIATLGFSFVWFEGKRPNPEKQSKLTRLTSSGKVTNAAVSPDGKYIVFAQKEGAGEGLWLKQIATGGKTQILAPQNVNFIGLAVSPGDDYVYYSLFSQNNAVNILTRIPLLGGSPQAVDGVDTNTSVSFSPDGKRFAYTESFTSRKETHLKIADADGSNQKTLLKTKGDERLIPTFRASPIAWSPDGATIACAIKESGGDASGTFFSILLIDPNDGSEKYLSERRWSRVENIAWKDAGTLALINSELGLPFQQIWEISRSTGEARRLTNDLNGYEWLSGAEGNLYTTQKNAASSLQLANVGGNGEMLELPKQILSESGIISDIVWASDGRIYYNSWASGKNEIWRINPDGTLAAQVTFDSNLLLSFAVSPVDNTLVFSRRQNNRSNLWITDSNGQNGRQLTESSSEDILPTFTPDGKSIIFQRGESQASIWRIDVDGGTPLMPVEIVKSMATHAVVASDNRTLVYQFMEFGDGGKPRWRIGLLNLDTGEVLKKLDFPLPVTDRDAVWHPKTNELTMVFGGNGLLFLSLNDGKYHTINEVAKEKITSFAWSPDANRLAFSQITEINDVVSLNDF